MSVDNPALHSLIMGYGQRSYTEFSYLVNKPFDFTLTVYCILKLRYNKENFVSNLLDFSK